MKRPRVEFVSAEEGETADLIVCMEWSDPPLLPDNQRSRCGVCGGVVQLRPNAPRKPMRVCVSCAPAMIRKQ